MLPIVNIVNNIIITNYMYKVALFVINFPVLSVCVCLTMYC